MSAQLLWDELLREVRRIVADALGDYRPNLARSTGVVPVNRLPAAGGSSGGTRGAVRLSDDLPTDVAATGDAGTSSDASRGDHVHALPATGVSAGSYGDATHVAAFSVNAQGRLTAASAVAIDRTPTGAAGGDLAGSYPDPAVAALQGYAVAATAPGDADRLRYSAAASAWQPSSLIWTPLTDGDESLIFAAGELIYVEMTP
jgi:hypothetical protein